MEMADGRGAAAFCRGFGLCIAYFASVSLPSHFNTLQHTVMTFPYPPMHHLGLPVASPQVLEAMRLSLVACGCSLFLGCRARLCLVTSFCNIAYATSIDRTWYNNHYVLLLELCLLLALLDGRCLCWPWSQLQRGERPALPRWQLLALQCLVLTPYLYGALAKLNFSWLLDAQPVHPGEVQVYLLHLPS